MPSATACETISNTDNFENVSATLGQMLTNDQYNSAVLFLVIFSRIERSRKHPIGGSVNGVATRGDQSYGSTLRG